MKTENMTKILMIAALLVFGSPAIAKVRSIAPAKAKPIETSRIRGASGEAALKVLRPIQVAKNENSVQFQDGKSTETIEFYKSPRCYLHFRKDSDSDQGLLTGHNLRVSKIDNIYANGSVHVTFWFDHDSKVSNLSCITNYNHTLTLEELKTTLGSDFQVAITKSVENGALFNTVPQKNVKVLSEDSPDHNVYSARIILTDS